MSNASLSKDTIPLDAEAYIERLVASVLRYNLEMLEQEEDRAQIIGDLNTLRRQAQQEIAPYAMPTRVACKRCYFRMRHAPPM